MKNKLEFLPFHAINEFMRPDFRLTIIRSVMSTLPDLPEQLRDDINKLTRRHVNIPGFRNSEKAPTMMKVIPTSKAFEKHPDLVAVIIAAWAEIHADLRTEMYAVLQKRNWQMYPAGENINIEQFMVRAPSERNAFETSMLGGAFVPAKI